MLHPLDTIRARAQRRRLARSAVGGGALFEPELFENVWAGIGPALITAAPQAGVFFAARELVRRDLKIVVGPAMDDATAALVAIAAASLAYWAVRAPSDVVKQARQLQTKQQQQQEEEEEKEREKDETEKAAAAGTIVAINASLPAAEVPLVRYIVLGARAWPACVLCTLPEVFGRVLSYRAWKHGLGKATAGTVNFE